MTSDLVERLRGRPKLEVTVTATPMRSVLDEAADEIERLRAEGIRREYFDVERTVRAARRAAFEEAAKVAKVGWMVSARKDFGEADQEADMCEEIATAIRALGEKG